jgi:nucleotide-binding universal stress UspA family protein
MKILAAIDDSWAAKPVLETAVELGRLLQATVEAVHVRENGAETARAVAEACGVPLRMFAFAPVPALIDALNDADVLLAVIGARGLPGGPRPAGHIALAIVERATKPVVVVPPEVSGPRPGGIRRVLVPLNGHASSADATARALRLLGRSGVTVETVHVFERETTPLFLDRPERDLELWSDELLARVVAAPGTPLSLRRGQPGTVVLEEAEGRRVDMIALGWSQRFSEGHARNVREILSRCVVPVLLLPVSATAVLDPEDAAVVPI